MWTTNRQIVDIYPHSVNQNKQSTEKGGQRTLFDERKGRNVWGQTVHGRQ